MRKGLALPSDCRNIEYPREAIRARVGDYELKYQLQIDEAGRVQTVSFPESSSRGRPFERVAQPELMKCRFEADGSKYIALGEIVFKLKDD